MSGLVRVRERGLVRRSGKGSTVLVLGKRQRRSGMPWTLGLVRGRNLVLVRVGRMRGRRCPYLRRRRWRYGMRRWSCCGRSGVALWAFLCFSLVDALWFGDGRVHSRPLPLDPSAIVRFNPSFLMCIATCYSHQLTSGNSQSRKPYLPQIRRGLCFLLAESTDGLALGDREDAGGVPRWMYVAFAATGVPQCAFQRHCSADDRARVEGVLAARASHKEDV